MGKRSDFKRRPQDCYDTPKEAVAPLLGHVPLYHMAWEPCAGSGLLCQHLEEQGMSLISSDIEPRHPHVKKADALFTTCPDECLQIITNPPWTRKILHPMIEHFSDMRPTWLLFDADWLHTKQSAPYLWRLKKIVSVGRVSWMQNGRRGKDNSCWYLFDAKNTGQAQFFGRMT